MASMQYSLNLGTMKSAQPARAAGGKDVFRLVVLADLSGRASSGRLETGKELAKRKPITVDVDNLDDVVRKMNIELTLPIGDGGGAVKIPIQSMDDFHPDQLYDNVEVFSSLSGLRQRLKTPSTFAKAAQEVQSWLGSTPADDTAVPQEKPRATAIPANGKLSDFARLVGQPTAKVAETPVNELLKQIVGPYVVAAKDPKADKLIASVDQSIGQAMRNILHHPDFQALESVWRSVEFLVRRLETDSNFRIVLYDISAEEFAADLSGTENLDETGLYSLLIEQPSLDAQQGAISAIVTTYAFEQTPPHAELLARVGRIAAAGQTAFLAAIGTSVIKKQKPEDIHPLVQSSWSALQSLPEAGYVGLTVPRFMLRAPFGDKSESIDRFEFEEFSTQEGTRSILYASGAILAGLLLGETYSKAGGLKKMNLGSVMSAGDMPYFVFEDAEGEQVALPCTERLLSVDLAAHVSGQRFMPILGIKGRPEVRLGSFQSLTGKPLAGPWAPLTIAPSAAPAAPAAAPTPAPAPAQEAPPPAPAAEQPAPAAPAAEAAPAAADAELDALLASLGSGPETPAAPAGGEEQLDPGLAALLADL
jgi:type VI secretion system ImpC/EvpB family protein/type VI secretion system ImpB/VipA family protein